MTASAQGLGAADGRQRSLTGSVLKALGWTFIGLAFFLGFPVFGPGIVASYAAKAAWRRRGCVTDSIKNVSLFFATPVFGLLYAATFPLVRLGVPVWNGGIARFARK